MVITKNLANQIDFHVSFLGIQSLGKKNKRSRLIFLSLVVLEKYYFCCDHFYNSNSKITWNGPNIDRPRKSYSKISSTRNNLAISSCCIRLGKIYIIACEWCRYRRCAGHGGGHINFGLARHREIVHRPQASTISSPPKGHIEYRCLPSTENDMYMPPAKRGIPHATPSCCYLHA